MARRVGRGIAVLAVVGLCLPLLLWVFGEQADPSSPGATARSARVAEARRHAAAPPPLSPLQAPGREPLGPERPAGLVLASDAGEPDWGDDQVWGRPSAVPPLSSVASIYTATYSGRVVDPAGHPVSKVRVAGGVGLLEGWGGLGASGQPVGIPVITDEAGRFRLVVKSALTLPTYLALTPPRETDLVARQQDLVGLGQGAKVDLGDLKLVQGGRIEGRVVGPGGTPVGGVKVRLQAGSLDVDRAGGGSLLLEPGVRALILESGGRGLSFDEGVLSSHSFDLEKSGSGVDEGAIRFLGSSRSLSFGGGSAPAVQATSQEDGRYAIHGVPPGNYTIVALLRPYAVARRDAVDVRAGRATRGVNLELGLGPVLEVEVRDGRGLPLAGASVSGSDSEGMSFNLTTNAEGVALTEPLATRRVELHVSAPGQRPQSSQILVPEGQVSGRAARFRAQVTLSPAGGLRLSTSGVGSPFGIRRGSREWVQPTEAAESEAGGDEAGGLDYTFEQLQPGRYDFMSSNGTELYVLARDVVVRAQGVVDLGTLQPIRVEPLRIRILDDEGRALASANLACEGSYSGSAMTDAEGRAELVLYPGRHLCQVTRAGHADATLSVEGGEARTFRLPRATSSLTLRVAPSGDGAGGPHTLALRRNGLAVQTLIFQDEVKIPIGIPGRYSVEIDGYSSGHVEVGAGEAVEFLARGPEALDLELTVLKATGLPAPGAEVLAGTRDPRPGAGALPPFSGLATGMVHTDDQGVARVRLLRGPALREVFARVVSEGQESVLRIPLGEEARLVRTLRLESSAGATLEVEAGSAGSAGALVELKPLTAQTPVNQLATLDGRGRVVFAGVRPGRYRVTILAEDGTPSAASAEVEVDLAGAQVTLESS